MDKDSPKSGQGPEISFRPVTEGLGFHPFSDGLPYAPIIKKPRINAPAGATVAGPVRNAVSMPPLRRSLGASVPPFPQVSIPIVATKMGVAKTPAVSPKKIESEHPFHQYGFTYLIKRFMAYVFDVMTHLLVSIFVMGSLIWRQEISSDVLMDSSVMFVGILSLFFLHWGLMTLQEVIFKTTVGKRIFGMVFDGHRMLILLRAILFIPSAGFFGLGVLWSLVDRQKAGWHDRATQVQPVEIGRY